MNSQHLLTKLAFCIGILGCLLAGCSDLSDFDKPPKIKTVQEAATVHIAPLSVSRWADYVGSLQPQFPITPSAALGLALPRTYISQNNVADVLSAGLQVGLPQSTATTAATQALNSGLTNSTNNTASVGTSNSTSNTSGTTTSASGTVPSGSTAAISGSTGSTMTTSTVATNGGATTTQTTTTQSGPGTLPPNLLPAATSPKASGLTPAAGATALDPLLTYAAATAIYQEVQLLNNYVNDAVHRYGYVPYVARVQVSVVPTTHNEPYDVYVDLGMFTRCRGVYEEKPVVVIPLLVTDDVETGQSSTAVDNARQLALSLGAITGNVAAQAGLSQLKDAFKSILGTDYNSLYMVTRAADNVLQVRFGAARSPNPNVKYSMVAQTHDVSFLVLVNGAYAARVDGDNKPIGCFAVDPQQHAIDDESDKIEQRGPQVWISGYTRLRSANSGQELLVDRAAIRRRGIEIMRRFQNAGEKPMPYDDAVYQQRIAPLISDIQQNWASHFAEDYCKYFLGINDSCVLRNWGTTEAAWTALSSVINMSEYSSTYFDLPLLRRPALPAGETVYLRDNCKDSATMTVGGLGGFSPTQFRASLQLSLGVQRDGGSGGSPVRLGSTSITQASSGGPFTIQFPSLAPFGALKSLSDSGGIAAACPPKSAVEAKAAAAKTAADQYQADEKTYLAAAAAEAKAAKGTPPAPAPAPTGAGAGNPAGAAPTKGEDKTSASAATAAAAQKPASAVPTTIGDKASRPAVAADAPSRVPGGGSSAAAESTLAKARAKADASRALAQKAQAEAAAAQTPAPLALLGGARIVLERLGDDRWRGTQGDVDTDRFSFESVAYEASPAAPTASLSLASAADTVLLAPTTATSPTGNNATVRLFVSAGANLADVVVSFSGGTLVSVPAIAPGATYLAAVEAGETPAQAPATLKIMPPNGLAFDTTVPVVMDVGLQGLVAGRALVVTAVGHDKNKVIQGTATIGLPVAAAASANNSNTASQGK